MPIPATLRAITHQLRVMVAHGVQPTPHELLMLATRIEREAQQLEETTVFAPAREVQRGLSVIEGGRA